MQRDISCALDQLAAAVASKPDLPLPRYAALRPLWAPVREKRQAIMETMLSRADAFHAGR